jgi:uncharacterized repeat protein (TIGR03803 family)
MLQASDISGKCLLGFSAALALFAPLHAEAKGGFSVLYAFQGGNDGANPAAGLTADKQGNFYGTTNTGGSETDCGEGPLGCGTVFKLAPSGTETVLHSFCSQAKCTDGAYPASGLIEDKKGDLTGTTYGGGNTGCYGFGCGTVFRLARNGRETVLHTFAGGSDGAWPIAGLIVDEKGNFYGTTFEGGSAGCGGTGCGTIFKVASDGTETVLYAFTGGTDGNYPHGSLIVDKQGNLYGTASAGGNNGCDGVGCGTVFKLAPNGALHVLYTFAGGNDGSDPVGSLLADAKGNFYTTTSGGGDTACNSGYGCGTVVEIAAHGQESVLHAFSGARDGALPQAGMLEDDKGNFYGTATEGGGGGCSGLGCGTVWKLAPDGKLEVLYRFTGGSDGDGPAGSLILDGGDLYSSASAGGGSSCMNPEGMVIGCGTLFKVEE